jgi:hypothetical protein
MSLHLCLTFYFFTEVPFARIGGIFDLAVRHLQSSAFDEIRKSAELCFLQDRQKHSEKDTLEHLQAWAYCDFIPAFGTHDERVFRQCIYRPDFTWVFPDLVVILECDENAHTSYDRDKEYQRMLDLMDCAGKKRKASGDDCITSSETSVVFIRFNPSLPGFSSQLKYTMLCKLLMSVFARDKTYVHNERVLVHMFYPKSPHIWHTKCLVA